MMNINSPVAQSVIPESQARIGSAPGKIKALVGAAIMSALMCGAPAAKAEGPQWNGIQLANALSFSKGPVEATALNLTCPKQDVNNTFLYVGTKLNLGENVWVAPYVGGVTGFMGREWAMASLWGRASGGNFNVFAESDLYLRDDNKVFYNYISGGYNVTDDVELGLQAEGVDKDFSYGGHVGVAVSDKIPSLNVALQSYSDPQNDWATAARVVTRLSF